MKMSLVKEVLLYRYRFALGYLLYGLFVIILLFTGIGDIPRGLTMNEMKTVVTSAAFRPADISDVSLVDAPYHIVQNASIHFLGLSEFSIKLPSVIFGLIAAVALVVMLSRWFQPRIAVITGIIAVTTTPFLVMGRLGLPLIMMTFWLSIILLSATRILHSNRHRFFWKLLLAASVGLSLYTPLMIYPLIALLVAGLLHPHVRYVISTMRRRRLIAALALLLVAIAPLIWSVYRFPDTLSQLAGLPDNLARISLRQIADNIIYVAKSTVRIGTPVAGELITPMFGIVTLVILLLGLLKTLQEWYSARSYMIGLWLLLLVPVIIVNPYYLPAVYIPSVLLLAIGVETLIRSWYRLFPRNPYARIAGLIPLTILIATIALTNTGRYFYGYVYAPDTGSFQTELAATQKALKLAALKNQPVVIITTPQKRPFYELLSRQRHDLKVTDVPAVYPAVIMHQQAYARAATIYGRQQPYYLYTNPFRDQGLDVRVYARPST